LTDGDPETSNGWVSVRNDKVTLDDETIVIEAYSPKYVTNCTHTSQFNYFKGLPTSIYVNLTDNNQTIQVSYINPDYIRKLMDGNSTSSTSQEIQNIVESSFKDVGIDVRNDDVPPPVPEQFGQDANTSQVPTPNENS